ncbi:hypothetical protein [Myxacorys almedinensis]|uniref:Uncharacterized protein n=1 Tax=Myxacorys almedinensis A TaxID=2690445 RepID=A0A8J8CLF3_9CYAN|nr:hypothetical protein [Myxacorys almedinensis]NDJ16037.1 hypothetical protein [Myxacorys almedinensis A]
MNFAIVLTHSTATPDFEDRDRTISPLQSRQYNKTVARSLEHLSHATSDDV